jgi:hypothetical protein
MKPSFLKPYVSPPLPRFVTSVLKMETACFSETLASTYKTTWHQNPIYHQHHSKTLFKTRGSSCRIKLHGAETLLITCEYAQVKKKIFRFYGNRMFITVFTRARHLPLSWTRRIQSTPSHPTSLTSTLIRPSDLFL